MLFRSVDDFHLEQSCDSKHAGENVRCVSHEVPLDTGLLDLIYQYQRGGICLDETLLSELRRGSYEEVVTTQLKTGN